MDIVTLTAAKILAFPETQSERLFSTPDTVKAEFRQLAQIWHPDKRPDDPEAAKVFAHLTKLHKAALEKSAAGIWEKPDEMVLPDVDGHQWRIPYKVRHSFELGQMLYGPKVAAFIIDKDHAELFKAGIGAMDKFTFANDAMKTEASKYLPHVRRSFTAKDGRGVLVIDKTKDVFLLGDVVTALGGALDPKHAAWIISSLLNIACYLEYAGIVHNAISAETCFVSPEFHSIMLYGGWWYSAKAGASIKYLPRLTHTYAPPDIVRAKKADTRTDRTMIRVLGRQLLGDVTGMKLASMGIPKPMADYLRNPIGASAVADYTAWRKALEDSFGARRFVKLDVPESAIFKGE